MAENWTAIAAEISDALGEVGFAVTLHEPGSATGDAWNPTLGAETDHSVIAVDDQIRVMDASGVYSGKSMRVLTVSAGDVVPLKGWGVTVRGVRHRVEEVQPLAPGGVDLLFDLVLGA